jgi:hypothetical protein
VVGDVPVAGGLGGVVISGVLVPLSCGDSLHGVETVNTAANSNSEYKRLLAQSEDKGPALGNTSLWN